MFLNKEEGQVLFSAACSTAFCWCWSRNILQAIGQKIKEWVKVELEKQYTKEEIITMYLNIYDFDIMEMELNQHQIFIFKRTY